MASSRHRKGKAAVEGGEFDPFGFQWPTLQQEIAGGDLDAAYRAARDLEACLRDVWNEMSELQSDLERFVAAQEAVKHPAEAEGDGEGYTADELVVRWHRWMATGHQDHMRAFAWRLVGYCCRFCMSDHYERIRPVLGALTATRKGPVAVLGYLCNSMTLALYRVMDGLRGFVLEEDDGMSNLADVWRAKVAGLPPQVADKREAELLADPEVAAALSAVQLSKFVDHLYDFFRELDVDEAENEVQREFMHAAAFRIDNRLRPPKPQPDGDPAHGMTRQAADARARELAREDPSFYTVSDREQARRIGCHFATWRATAFYDQAKWKKPKAGRHQPNRRTAPPNAGGPVAAPKAISLTKTVEAAVGEGGEEEVLERLIAEQQGDAEPSPLDPDPPDGRQKGVRARKRL